MVFITFPRILDKSDFIPYRKQMSILELLLTSAKNKVLCNSKESHKQDL